MKLVDKKLADYLDVFEENNSMRRQWGLPDFWGFRKNGQPVWSVAGAADGIFYRDLREPHIVVDEASTTLSTTDKMLWPIARTILPANYFRVGKVIKISAFGKATTDGTAGNYIFKMYYGSADATGQAVAGATVAGTVSQTNISWRAEGIMECRVLGAGATGTARLWGEWRPAVALLASTLQPYTFPASAPTDSTTIDFTLGTQGPNFQLQRSGAGVWTATTTNILFEALN